MPKFVVERDFGDSGEDEIAEVAARSDMTIAESFPDIVWEQSHVVAGDDGTIKAFCIYEAPSAEQLRDHAARVGGHEVHHIYEVVGEVTPGNVTLSR